MHVVPHLVLTKNSIEKLVLLKNLHYLKHRTSFFTSKRASCSVCSHAAKERNPVRVGLRVGGFFNCYTILKPNPNPHP